MNGISIIIPVHNEEKSLERNILLLLDYMKRTGPFEILLVCNGCTDRSVEIAENLSGRAPEIRSMDLEERGLGRAIRAGMRAASFNTLMFYAVDLPFGLEVMGDSIREAERSGAVIIGSKGHRASRVERGPMRAIFSSAISFLNNAFFRLGVRDTQGSILFYREPLERFFPMLDSPGPFFQTQLLIYSRLAGLTLLEIPVELRSEARRTRFRASDGLKFLAAILRERFKLLGGVEK